MEHVNIVRSRGAEAKLAIDEFYRKNGSKGTAREDDLFFIAYCDDKIVGCVRYCIEEGTSMLRTMYVDSNLRKQGIGRALLKALAQYLDDNQIRNVHCLPFPHLKDFYQAVGFKIVSSDQVPQFLLDRSTAYAANGTKTLFMRRP